MFRNNTRVKKMKVKMHMDCGEEIYKIIDKILNKIPNRYGDDVFEFDLEVKNIKDITEKVGVDKEGCRAFHGIEISE